MNTFNQMSDLHYSLFRFTCIVLLYLAYSGMVISMGMSYVYTWLRLPNIMLFASLVTLTVVFNRYCPKRKGVPNGV